MILQNVISFTTLLVLFPYIGINGLNFDSYKLNIIGLNKYAINKRNRTP